MSCRVRTTINLVLTLSLASAASAEEKHARPVDGIMDNSFLVEEAYNQEENVVQHIFNAVYGVDKLRGPDDKSWNMSFTQEWPVFSQTHQFSYTVPYSFIKSDGHWNDGGGDVLLNYRFQAYLDEKTLTGFSPRFSLVLPTSDGNDTLGYQWMLPFSTTIGDRWFVHANAGLTYLPNVSGHDLLDYNLGASAIYCVNERLNFMLEWIGNWNETPADNGHLDHEFSSVISPGVRYAFNFENGSQLVVGAAVPVGLTGSAPDIGAFLYFSFEHFLPGTKKK